MKQVKYILFILSLLFSSVSGCQCTACSSENTGQKTIEKIPQNIIPLKSVFSGIQKEILQQSNDNRDSGSAESYRIEQGGRLFITGSDVYYVKNGDIAWQSSAARKYQKLKNRYYVATGDFVFCAMEDGRVLWKTGLLNSGSCEIKNGVLFVLTPDGEKKLNPKSGEGVL